MMVGDNKKRSKKLLRSMAAAGLVTGMMLGATTAHALGSLSQLFGGGLSIGGQFIPTALIGPGSLQGLLNILNLLGGPNVAAGRAPDAISKFTGQVIPNGAVALVWTADMIVDDGNANSDFMAVIDAEPNSTRYGQVIWTANLPSVPLANIPGTAYGHTSDIHNEPHHMTSYTSYINPATGKKYAFAGGLISGNIFRFDISDVRAIPTPEIAVCGTELTLSSLSDDFLVLPNGRIATTYMGGKSYYGPGTVTEFAPMRKGLCVGGLPYISLLNSIVPNVLQNEAQYISENSAIKLGTGIVRYKPQHLTGITDAGLEAYPHGMTLNPTGQYLITSDYANPASIGGGDPVQNLMSSTFLNGLDPLPGTAASIRQFGTTIRVWQSHALNKGPVTVSQVPDGPRVEDVYFHDEPEGQMGFSAMHVPGHDGAFSAAMCGGVLYYTSNVLAPQSANGGKGPLWNAVYDAGPCTGVGYFSISDDDKYAYVPVSGIASPGDPVYERDYVGEHDRRVLALDITPLVSKGNGATINCSFPAANGSRPGNTSLGLPTGGNALNNKVHNNGAADCPVVVGQVVNNSAMNYAEHGGAHFINIDRAGAPGSGLASGKRFIMIDYFVTLDHMGLQGTGSGGDKKIYVVNINANGSLSYDMNFRDELTGEVGLSFAGPMRSSFAWPNRGVTGKAKPHSGIFEYNGLQLKGAEAYGL
jgi:hypothetical protein